MDEQSVFNKYESKNGLLLPKIKQELKTQYNIFNAYQPHLLGLFGQSRIIIDRNTKFTDFVRNVGLNKVLEILGNKYSIQELEKAWDFCIGLQSGIISNYHHQELLKGFDFRLYEEILKIYYFAIAFDAGSNGEANPGTSLTVAHTCTGSNLILFAGVQIGSGNDWITGVTYNSVAMTQIGTVANNNRSYLFYLLAPATGNNNIVISSSNSVQIRAANASHTGALQSGVPDASGTQQLSAVTSITTSVTTVLNNCWMVAHCADDQGTLAAGTGSTQRAVASTASSIIGDSNGVITPAGAYSMQWTHGASGTMATVQASFAPFIAAAGGPDRSYAFVI